jgi:hypothetical protein
MWTGIANPCALSLAYNELAVAAAGFRAAVATSFDHHGFEGNALGSP